MKLTDYLSEPGISMDLKGADKSEILRNLVALLTKTVQVNDTEKIISTLEEREKLKTTGIGSGIAIPHCKSDEVDNVHIVVGISKPGIDFQALDEQPAHFFFLLVAPEKAGSEHLKASAKIVRLFREPDFRKSLLQCETAGEVIEYINENE